MTWFMKKGVGMVTGVREYVEISDAGLTIVTKEGHTETIAADTIVSALPLTANDELLPALRAQVAEVYPIGDAEKPGLMRDAIGAGTRTALRV